jgi:hypothetical protein
MSHDLFDLERLKITRETRAWLQGVAHKTGRSQQEIARDALHDRAIDEFEAARVLHNLDPREGLFRDNEAQSGDRRGRR